MTTEAEVLNTLYKVACSYLLYERAQDTQLRVAFTALVQERHNHFHEKEGTIVGEPNDAWRHCKNQICVSARQIIDDQKQMSIEINDFTVQLLDGYTIDTRKSGRAAVVTLSKKSNLITEPGKDLILKL